ncbi:MAG: hypothetical protein JWM40_784 [Frankiales bacterium]|nr:hypothetical protein [Frankiales bacterium]
MVELLRAGGRYQLTGPGGSVDVRTTKVTPRLFSWVAEAELTTGEPVFLKQFVSADGRALEKTYAGERDGARLAGRVMPSSKVALPLGGHEEQLLLGYAWRDLVTVDQLLRTDPQRLAELWPALMSYLGTCLTEAMNASPEGLKRRRLTEGTTPAVNFKGFEVRNIALDRATGAFCFFDTGPAYLGPADEAAARVVVSIWLLAWGHPLRLFLGGPPADLAEAAGPLAARTTRAALRREVELQATGRLNDVQATNPLTRMAKRLVFASIGRRYLRALRAWAEQHER